MGDDSEDYSKIVRKLKAHVRNLEMVQRRASSIVAEVESFNIHDIISRINRVQDLVDRIEIEVDNLEMRVSSIEHVGFRLRTGGQ